MRSANSVHTVAQRTLFVWALGALIAQASTDLPGKSAEDFQTTAQADASRRAAHSVGSSEPTNLALIRELQSWRNRALVAESRLLSVSGPDVVHSGPEATASRTMSSSSLKFTVLATLDAERVILVSCGKSSGVFEGALISVGDGVRAKVVEARSGVSAAVVENSFVGNVSRLDGQSAKLVLAR